jgi:acetyl-CoA carboxylase carboxyl transferase subunit alpha
MERELDFEKPIAEIEKMIDRLKSLSTGGKGDFTEQINELEKKLLEQKKAIYANLSSWETVQIAKHPKRPVLQDYISLMCSDFVELRGDRRFADDLAMKCGFATIGDEKVMLIGHNKGKNVDEQIERNFGMAKPDGYRKALRLMKLAEKYGLPVVTLIDTAGAFPGLEGEERGQHEAIARNLVEMARLQVPIICVVTGEGGSGGALGIGVGDVVLMLSHAVYSVISPEGCAGILWKDASFAPQAAEAMKPTAPSLKELGIIDEIIEEPVGGAHQNPAAAAEAVKAAVLRHIKKLAGMQPAKLTAKRFEKFSKIGKFNQEPKN